MKVESLAKTEKWNSDLLCLEWAEREATMMTDKTIRRRLDIRKDGKNGMCRFFVISDLINAFGAYDTREEIDIAWDTMKTAISPKRIHVEREWDTKLVDCCSLTDFFDFVLPHVRGPVATKIKRVRFTKYVKSAMEERSINFIWELNTETQRMYYGIQGMLFLFGEFGTTQMASCKWSTYKTGLKRRGEKHHFYPIGKKDACTADEFFDTILPHISTPSRRGVIKRKRTKCNSDFEKETPRKCQCIHEPIRVNYDSIKPDIHKTDPILPISMKPAPSQKRETEYAHDNKKFFAQQPKPPMIKKIEDFKKSEEPPDIELERMRIQAALEGQRVKGEIELKKKAVDVFKNDKDALIDVLEAIERRGRL